MEEPLKYLWMVVGGVSAGTAIAVAKFALDRFDKWRDSKKEKEKIHFSEFLESKKFDADRLQKFIEDLCEDNETQRKEAKRYRDGEEKYRRLAAEAFETIQEITNDMARMQRLQEQHSEEIAECRQREANHLATVKRLEGEIEDLKNRVGKVE